MTVTLVLLKHAQPTGSKYLKAMLVPVHMRIISLPLYLLGEHRIIPKGT